MRCFKTHRTFRELQIYAKLALRVLPSPATETTSTQQEAHQLELDERTANSKLKATPSLVQVSKTPPKSKRSYSLPSELYASAFAKD